MRWLKSLIRESKPTPPTVEPLWVMERRWGRGAKPLPLATLFVGKTDTTLNVTDHLTRIIADVAERVPEFSHIRPAELLVTYTAARNRSRYGLQARVTPMRFRKGTVTRRHGNHIFQVQRYLVDGREMLYLVTFCLPRFLDQTYDEKLLTIFHELHHISTDFNGDIRRYPGRYQVHSRSKDAYDAELTSLLAAYAASHPQPEVLNLLHYRTADLKANFGRVVAVKVPRPKMVPVRRAVAACRQAADGDPPNRS